MRSTPFHTGNHAIQHLLRLRTLQRQVADPTASTSVPGLPAAVVEEVETSLRDAPQAALDALVRALAAGGRIDVSYLAGERMLYASDTSHMLPRHAGHTSLTPGTRRPRPCRVVIGPEAFRSAGMLFTTVMHEWQHVLQFREPELKSEAVGELEARVWEVEHLEDTGLWRDPQHMAELPGQLRHWWELVPPDQQAAYARRYSDAQRLLREMNERRLEEQFRQQRGS